ncbi:MAG: 13E12 repeat family protein [Propionibacteriaceae bacterium]|nr:13E12 repeat family protein [Propionibacteriaceae bacterium]
MFEYRDDVSEAVDVLTDDNVSDIDKLRTVVRLRNMVDATEADLIAGLAKAHGWNDINNEKKFEEDERRWVPTSANRTLVDEALPLEIAVARHTSVYAASGILYDIVNLTERHPYTWQAIHELRIPVWQAQRVASTCLGYGLTTEETIAVDHHIQPGLGTIGVTRLVNLVKATVLKVAPEAVARKTQRLQSGRYVTTHPSDQDTATSYLDATLDTADALFFDATLDRVADVMAERGDTRDKDHRRAAAVGILATPALALSLLGVHTRRGMDPDQPNPEIPTPQQAERSLPVARVYVHLSGDALLRGEGVARVERLGPVRVQDLARVVGHARIRVTPVLHLGDNDPGTDRYDIPPSIREHVLARDAWEAFPYSSREARHLDLDHVNPYTPGREGQTRASNLAPLTRRAHRVKTHAGWILEQPQPGVFYWRTELGQTFRVGPNGTTDTTPTPQPHQKTRPLTETRPSGTSPPTRSP